jgi:sulfite reductase (ferredoxin)
MTVPTTTTPETTTELTPAKETPAQKVERIKREKPSWSIMDDIRRYSREGFSRSPPRTSRCASAPGGSTPGRWTRHARRRDAVLHDARADAERLHHVRDGARISDISDTYARSSIDITNRQNFQLHWLRIEDIPTIWESLAEVGWTSMGACGDNRARSPAARSPASSTTS